MTEGHREKKDFREIIQQNLEGLNEARSKIRQLEELIKTTQEENNKVGAAYNATDIEYTVYSDHPGGVDNLVSSTRILMETCDNYMTTDNQLTLAI